MSNKCGAGRGSATCAQPLGHSGPHWSPLEGNWTDRRARNSIQGRKANDAGDQHEAWMDAQHELALRLGIIARVDKTDPPAVIRKGRVEFGERTGADYVGMLGRAERDVYTGREIVTVPAGYFAVEAKSSAAEILYKAKVKPLQQQHLDEVARGGGLALLVAEFRMPPSLSPGLLSMVDRLKIRVFPSSPRRYACPWLETPWQVLSSAESVSEIGLLVAGWLVTGECYLERFHPRGTPTSPPKGKIYARE